MQYKRRLIPAVLTTLVIAGAMAGCTSPDKTAAKAAAEADIAFQQGRTQDALRLAHQAVAARDDVGDYWLLLGRISLAAGDYGGAFNAYENVIQFDRGNVEALRLLGQLGLSAKQPDKVDKYADQLLLLTPGDILPLVMKGGAALQRGEKDEALAFAEQALAKQPTDLGAQILKARVLAARAHFKEAAELIEGSLKVTADATLRLAFLKDLYGQSLDRPNYMATLKRLTAATPDDFDIQLEYADMLFQDGQQAAANQIIRTVMEERPKDIALAGTILELFLAQGGSAIPLDTIASQAANVTLEMKSVYAQYASEVGRPDIAVAILNGAIDGPVSSENADAKAAYAYAVGLQGRRADAMSRLNEIIAFDPNNPRALIARARFLAKDGKATEAITDARTVVTGDPQNATARLTLANVLTARGDLDLALAALREGVRANPGDTRLNARLARTLIGTGRRDAANDALRDMTRAVPNNLRARRLRLSIDPTAVPEKPKTPEPMPAPSKPVATTPAAAKATTGT
ncbi:tetratricopeptide repeat protein [Sphingomonas aliaeris]|uniref:Tetratricopeptide repeat protein n=1 Tax=Sphingomonas aliaeris TaxID=2759526 RepID=A0A974S4W5_9SPHN|nr:tetratricopeptide repeat protein [Sphingomonas aliaeris]QQV78058.1 tetratricopeptide repeat protein [Sphingomonas aliaeris]